MNGDTTDSVLVYQTQYPYLEFSLTQSHLLSSLAVLKLWANSNGFPGNNDWSPNGAIFSFMDSSRREVGNFTMGTHDGGWVNQANPVVVVLSSAFVQGFSFSPSPSISITGTPSSTYSPTSSWRPLTRTQTAVQTPMTSPSVSPTPTPSPTFLFAGSQIQFVRVGFPSTSIGIVNFAEFTLFNSSGVNIALGKPGNQSSFLDIIAYPASFGNDGSTSNFMHTVLSTPLPYSQWWEIDLLQPVYVSSLVNCEVWARASGEASRSNGLVVTFMDAWHNTLLSSTATTYGFPYTMSLPPLFAAVVPASPSSASTSSPTPSPTPYCPPALYRSLPRTDLVGTLMGNAWYPGTTLPAASETACRQSCCDAPACDAYTFASNDLQWAVRQGQTPSASCFLYTNVTALVPNSGYTSGALFSSYS